MLFDDGEEGKDNRILGFSTNELMTALCEAPTVYMDGKFKVVPEHFTQLCTLHGSFHGQMIPSAYFLLPDKERMSCTRMFFLIKRYATAMGLVFCPLAFRLDFEQVALNAVRTPWKRQPFSSPRRKRKDVFSISIRANPEKSRGWTCSAAIIF